MLLSLHPHGRACPCAPSRGSLVVVPGLGTKASFQPAVLAPAPPFYEWAGRKCSEWLENSNDIPAVAATTPRPQISYICSSAQRTHLYAHKGTR